jgi:hypothetical protein
MKIMNAHTFSNVEENIILKALLDEANFFLKESGVDNPDELPRAHRIYYDQIMSIYNNF